MVTLLCVIDQPSRSVAPSVSPPSSAPRCNRRQSLLRSPPAMESASTLLKGALDYSLRGHSGRSSQSAPLPLRPQLVIKRSISAVTALLASQIGTSLTYRASLGVSRAILSAQHSSSVGHSSALGRYLLRHI
ncbi:hypothetical protein TYRP_000662 [Tyrophagus putrescentiae]|nr:hypothetical protein TYRP_000662 [Tyrophagus putrescentiae]